MEQFFSTLSWFLAIILPCAPGSSFRVSTLFNVSKKEVAVLQLLLILGNALTIYASCEQRVRGSPPRQGKVLPVEF